MFVNGELQRVRPNDGALRKRFVENQDMHPGPGNRHMQHLAALGVWSRIVFPDKGRAVSFSIQDHAVKLFALAFVHVHNMNALQRVAP